MAKRRRAGRSTRATGNRQGRSVKRPLRTGKLAEPRTGGPSRTQTSHTSGPGKRAIERAGKHVAKTSRKSKARKPKVVIGGTRKLKKLVHAKPRKKIGTSKKTVASESGKSVLGRTKSVLRRLKSRKPVVIRRKRGRSTRPFPFSSKARTSKPRAATLRRVRPYASMRFFSDAKTVRADVSRRTASVIGSYLSGVRRFRDTNNIEPLGEFAGRSVKDVRGTVFPLETDPNVLYRLNSALEPFEEVYRIFS
jgi:hypothetical protein